MSWPRQSPRLPRSYVARRVLWEQLDASVLDASVTILVAPAGSGKTLGVAGWLQRAQEHGGPTEGAVAWVQADRTWEARRLEALLEDADTSGGPDQPAAATPSLVVIDDAHLLPASAVRVLEQWLSSAPERLKVLLLSRWDLPLAQLVPQLLGQCVVLRGDLLRLDADEGAELVRAHVRTESDEVVSLVTGKAQGWAAALVFLARAVATSSDSVAAARRFAQEESRVSDLVASEVFASLRPRERHLLLCTAHEGTISVATAAHLTHDPLAGQVLADLETTGLLVTRVGDATAGQDTASDSPGSETPDMDLRAVERRYVIHPLLAEVVRRRLVAGGVDVVRAKSTVTRAVGLDAARGQVKESVRRLTAIGEPDAAATYLQESGPTLVLDGRGHEIREFARRYPDTIEARPQTWFALALERWLANDVAGSVHWLDRLREGSVNLELREDATYDVQLACARLMRGRLGLESLVHAVAHGQRRVAGPVFVGNRAYLPVLLIELGASQAWLGHLSDAEANLSHALHLSKDYAIPTLTLAAMTHLASVFFLDGREHLCRQMAREALELIASGPHVQPGFSEHRARLLLTLAAVADLPLHEPETGAEPVSGPVHTADLTVRFWLHVQGARAALASGSVIEAERVLAAPLGVPSVPSHLQAVMLLERGWVAFLAHDRGALLRCVEDLRRIGYPGEVSMLCGLAADLAGDQRGGAKAFVDAAERCTMSQPPYRLMSLVCAAQLLDQLGHAEQAAESIRTALVESESRRNAVPFLGWVSHGTPVHVLLDRLDPLQPCAWLEEIAASIRGFAGVSALLAPAISLASERDASVPDVGPSLSPRERDVLQALARGSTYADIAAHLVLSENTIKTHVSSLYSKLGATRRSEALARARQLSLI